MFGRRRRTGNAGFTLVELMVVVLVIGILVAFAVPQFLGARTRSQQAATRATIALVATTARALDPSDASAPTLAALQAAEPALSFQTADSTGPGMVSVATLTTTVPWNSVPVSGTWTGFAVRAADGTCFGTVLTVGQSTPTFGRWTPSGSTCSALTAVAAATAPSWDTVGAPTGNTVTGADGAIYELVARPATWADAVVAAASRRSNGRQGYLATVTSAAEHATVTSVGTGVSAWLGGQDAGGTGDWRWTTGPEATQAFWSGSPGAAVGGSFAAWNSGEPGLGEPCLHKYGGGPWNNLGCTALLAYVVEYR